MTNTEREPWDNEYDRDRYANYEEALKALRPLSFKALREANIARLPLFKNKHGRVAHTQPDGGDWSVSEWLEAVTGEIGEFANLHKKVRRGDYTMEEARADLGRELADVVVYLDILAFRLGVDLGKAVRDKFNETSARIGVPVYV